MALTDPAPATGHRLTTVEVSEGAARDPLAWLASAPAGMERWFWEVPADDSCWVGLGCAATVPVGGGRRFEEATRIAEDLFGGLEVHAPDGAPLPRLAAGFAFEPGGGDGPWTAFGGGRLLLPALQVHRMGDRTWVTSLPGPVVGVPGTPAPLPLAPLHADASRWAPEAERDAYRGLVQTALGAIRSGAITKAVPCRSIRIPGRPDLPSLLATLRATFPACAVFCVDTGSEAFAGATPERLAAVDGGRLDTAALAGSAPRHQVSSVDEALGQGLVTSPKERAEHGHVVDAVVMALEGLGLEPLMADEPQLLKLHGIQHLHTPISADLTDGTGLLDVVGALHPTPAVAGIPRNRAVELRHRHEHLDRGWYAGAVGWLDPEGDGEFRVALRSALLEEAATTLFAGAGVVEGSDPDRELLETEVKLGTLLGPVLAAIGSGEAR